MFPFKKHIKLNTLPVSCIAFCYLLCYSVQECNIIPVYVAAMKMSLDVCFSGLHRCPTCSIEGLTENSVRGSADCLKRLVDVIMLVTEQKEMARLQMFSS